MNGARRLSPRSGELWALMYGLRIFGQKIFVASSAKELRTMLASYYGGLPGSWIRQATVDLERIEDRGSGRSEELYRRAFTPIPFS